MLMFSSALAIVDSRGKLWEKKMGQKRRIPLRMSIQLSNVFSYQGRREHCEPRVRFWCTKSILHESVDFRSTPARMLLCAVQLYREREGHIKRKMLKYVNNRRCRFSTKSRAKKDRAKTRITPSNVDYRTLGVSVVKPRVSFWGSTSALHESVDFRSTPVRMLLCTAVQSSRTGKGSETRNTKYGRRAYFIF